MKDKQQRHIDKIIKLLCDDPEASGHDIEYINDNLNEYLNELITKDNNVAHGIVAALEVYLNK